MPADPTDDPTLASYDSQIDSLARDFMQASQAGDKGLAASLSDSLLKAQVARQDYLARRAKDLQSLGMATNVVSESIVPTPGGGATPPSQPGNFSDAGSQAEAGGVGCLKSVGIPATMIFAVLAILLVVLLGLRSFSTKNQGAETTPSPSAGGGSPFAGHWVLSYGLQDQWGFEGSIENLGAINLKDGPVTASFDIDDQNNVVAGKYHGSYTWGTKCLNTYVFDSTDTHGGLKDNGQGNMYWKGTRKAEEGVGSADDCGTPRNSTSSPAYVPLSYEIVGNVMKVCYYVGKDVNVYNTPLSPFACKSPVDESPTGISGVFHRR